MSTTGDLHLSTWLTLPFCFYRLDHHLNKQHASGGGIQQPVKLPHFGYPPPTKWLAADPKAKANAAEDNAMEGGAYKKKEKKKGSILTLKKLKAGRSKKVKPGDSDSSNLDLDEEDEDKRTRCRLDLVKTGVRSMVLQACVSEFWVRQGAASLGTQNAETPLPQLQMLVEENFKVFQNTPQHFDSD